MVEGLVGFGKVGAVWIDLWHEVALVSRVFKLGVTLLNVASRILALLDPRVEVHALVAMGKLLLARPATVIQGMRLKCRLDVDILGGLLLQGSGFFALVHKCPFAVQMIDNVQAFGLQFIPSLFRILLRFRRQCRLFLQVLINGSHGRFANPRLFILLIGLHLQLIYEKTAELGGQLILPPFSQL